MLRVSRASDCTAVETGQLVSQHRNTPCSEMLETMKTRAVCSLRDYMSQERPRQESCSRAVKSQPLPGTFSNAVCSVSSRTGSAAAPGAELPVNPPALCRGAEQGGEEPSATTCFCPRLQNGTCHQQQGMEGREEELQNLRLSPAQSPARCDTGSRSSETGWR